ncbi:hypothetical protein [Halpernia sp. GG3]
MKQLFYFCLLICFISCDKSSNTKDSKTKTDSLNEIIAKKNDSITKINNTNFYFDWSGTHKLTHNSISKNGEISFDKTGKDEYKVSGSINAGKNNLKITGTMKVVSDIYMNLEGKIIQNIKQDGATFTRKENNTFKKQGKFWRLQNKVNGAGFVDYIDIYK